MKILCDEDFGVPVIKSWYTITETEWLNFYGSIRNRLI